MPSKLEIKQLFAGYNGNKVLKGIDLNVHPGKVTALIGPSGCGKTTLLRCINRMSELTKNCSVKGQILLDGEDIFQMDPMLLRRKVGMVFQKPNPFPMSVRENILFGIKAAKLKVDQPAVIESSLTKAAIWDELKDRLDDNAFGLSVGQQQRVCIARSLAISPKFILMDEPAASLDPSSAAKVETSIVALKGDYTVVIVTHNMQQARRVSDYAVFMYLGEIVEFGETDQVFCNPQRQETQDYINGQFG
ncbi:MAG: phosphate ABC transporter ATP-binding protein [Anaerolineaceae bacterium]|nr:phosphate ABC transporter ATP-binding protein [Anaerolineaceae bacterium]